MEGCKKAGVCWNEKGGGGGGSRDEWTLSRRGVLVGKPRLKALRSDRVPWLSEYYTRPKGDSYYERRRARRLQRPLARTTRWYRFESVFESLLPANRGVRRVAAKECLKTGESLMEEESGSSHREFASNRKVTPERIQAESKSETFNRGVLRMMGAYDISKRNI